jgi:hypothetical protein
MTYCFSETVKSLDVFLLFKNYCFLVAAVASSCKLNRWVVVFYHAHFKIFATHGVHILRLI